MTRPSLLRTHQHPYHVTSRTLDREFFPVPLEVMWPVMLSQLQYCHQLFQLRIHAFVLMGNHFHLLCQTPHENLDEIMAYLLKGSSLSLRQGPLWAPRYKWSLISAPSHYYQVYRYIFQNALRAKLVNKVEDYPYSSLHEVPFPICTHVPMTFGGEKGEHLWLNEKYDEEDQKLIRLGLRKFQFDINQRKIKAFNRLSLPG